MECFPFGFAEYQVAWRIRRIARKEGELHDVNGYDGIHQDHEFDPIDASLLDFFNLAAAFEDKVKTFDFPSMFVVFRKGKKIFRIKLDPSFSCAQDAKQLLPRECLTARVTGMDLQFNG